MARAYLRLADQAKRNDETKIIHEMAVAKGEGAMNPERYPCQKPCKS